MAAGSIVVDLLMRTGSFETDTARAAKSLKRLQKEADDLKRAFKASFAGNLLADFAQQLGASLARLPGTVLRSIDSFNDLSDATGETIEKLSALEDVAARNGTSFDTASDALIKLNKALEEGRKDSESAAGQAIRNLGLDIKELIKLSPVERLQAVGKELNSFSGENKLAYNMALLGKSVRETAPLLKDLGESGALVGTLSTQAAQEVEKFNKELFALEKNATDVARSLAGPIVTAINETAAAFRKSRADGESWWRFITDRFNQSNGFGPSAKDRVPSPNAGIGGREFNPPLATLKPITGADDKGAASKAAAAAKRAASDRIKLAEFAAEQQLKLEEITAQETAEAWSYVNKSIEKGFEDRTAAAAKQQEQYLAFIDEQIERDEEAARAFADALETKTSALDEFAKNAAENIQRSFGDTLVAAMDGNWRSIGDGFRQMLNRMVAEALSANIVRALFGGDAKGNVTGTGGLLGELLKSGGKLLGFASGGEPPVGRPSLVGERGPELFVPRTAGTIIPAAQTARIGGGVVVNQVIHVTTTGPGDRRSMAQLQADIGIATQRAIARNT